VEESEGLDTFDWTLRIAGTPSGNTGPTTDHTTGRFGNFLFFLQRHFLARFLGAKCFNSLPDEIMSPASVGNFKSKLKPFLWSTVMNRKCVLCSLIYYSLFD
jgi:hypothetical protein